ncbi:MAG TPA: 1,4-dihydroxy-2-naphthoate octaprenyltransferase [Desulfotomaculum sp.]|nr:1,4-dihydroxy-2-naphthoate octaprenyltransferase [Desulfotomaculum sp.]HAU30994.1 1,4-dihydroxy-2-naphthoate octaprenyltransferase [Desulfotomaculum sp.]
MSLELNQSTPGIKVYTSRKTGGRNILWRLFRPHTLTASFVPVLIGSALAYLDSARLHLLLLGAMLTASVLIQAATNMFNEYYDFKRGLDTAESVGIAGAITNDGVKANTVLYLALACLAIAALLGVYICISSSWWLALIGAVCMAVGYLYTGGPYPIAYTFLGELFAGTFMGTGIVLLSYFIQTGTVTLNSFLISVPSFLLTGAILMSNNIRDLDGDQKNGRHTLAILLGHERAVKFLGGMFIFTYLWTTGLVLFQVMTLWSLLVLLSIPKASKAVRSFKGKTLPIEMMPGMKDVALTNTIFGLLLTTGLVLSIISKSFR